MSTTGMLTGDSNTVKLYEMQTWNQVMHHTPLGDAFDNGAIFYVDKFLGRQDSAGDVVNFDYIGRMTGKPVGEGGTLDGQEKALDIKAFNMTINESRDAVRYVKTGIEPQRTNINFSKQTRIAIRQRAGELMTQSFFNQLAGAAPESWTSVTDGETYATSADKLHVTGHNTVTAPSSNRIIRAGGGANDQAITSSNLMSYSLIDYMLEENASSLQPIQPLDDGYFRFYISPYDFVNLKQDVTSPIQWGNIALSEIESGAKDNMLKNRYMQGKKFVSGGIYQNVKILESRDIPYGVRSDTNAVITTVRRNILVGRNAACFASPYGGRPTDEDVPMKFIEQLADYGKYKGEGFEMLYGIKKMKPTGGVADAEDVGAFVIATYATAHT